MILDLPVVYRALIVPPRKRTPVAVPVAEFVPFEIAEMDVGASGATVVDDGGRPSVVDGGAAYLPAFPAVSEGMESGRLLYRTDVEGLRLVRDRFMDAGNQKVLRKISSDVYRDEDYALERRYGGADHVDHDLERLMVHVAGDKAPSLETWKARDVLRDDRAERIAQMVGWARGFRVVGESLVSSHRALVMKVRDADGRPEWLRNRADDFEEKDVRFWYQQRHHGPVVRADRPTYRESMTGFDPAFRYRNLAGLPTVFPDFHSSSLNHLLHLTRMLSGLSSGLPGMGAFSDMTRRIRSPRALDVPSQEIAGAVSDLYLSLCESVPFVQDSLDHRVVREIDSFLRFWTDEGVVEPTPAFEWLSRIPRAPVDEREPPVYVA